MVERGIIGITGCADRAARVVRPCRLKLSIRSRRIAEMVSFSETDMSVEIKCFAG